MTSLYFNNAFAKKPLREAIDAMFPFFVDQYENPLTESDGAQSARDALQNARERVASMVHADPCEIYFTSSGTEANNWALKGASWNKKRNHLVVSAIEHFSVYQTAEHLRREGVELTIVPVNRAGLVDIDGLAGAIHPSTLLVSVQAASDEIGVVQNFPAIAALKKQFPDVLFHTDAIQFVCYENLDLRTTPFDLVSLSSNAIYGPPGIAALYIRTNTRLAPLLHGGMQEEGLRPGLQSIALAVGFGKAAEINLQLKEVWKANLLRLQQSLFDKMTVLGVDVTGSQASRLADNVHLVFDVDGEALLTLLLEKGIRASSGSTCYQYAQKESHVLKALGISPDKARGAVLFTLGAEQLAEDIQILEAAVEETLRHLRRLKP
jgi:cysteine desulfurase